MRDPQMTVMPRHPADGDEIFWNVEATLRSECDVMQGGFRNVLTADAAALCVSFEYEVPDVTGDETQLFEFDL